MAAAKERGNGGESLTSIQDNQDETSNWEAAHESIDPNDPTASKTTVTTDAFQACWSKYTEDKAYLIVNPNQATKYNNNIHLMCVHKDGDPTDVFQAANMLPLPPFQQSIVMGSDDKINATFDNSKDVIGDPDDVSDGISFVFPPAARRPPRCNRWSVKLIPNSPRPARKTHMYQGAIDFRLITMYKEQITDPWRRILPAQVSLYSDEGATAETFEQENEHPDIPDGPENTGLSDERIRLHQHHQTRSEERDPSVATTEAFQQQNEHPDIPEGPQNTGLKDERIRLHQHHQTRSEETDRPERFRQPEPQPKPTPPKRHVPVIPSSLAIAIIVVAVAVVCQFYSTVFFGPGEGVTQQTLFSGKPVVLLLNDEYGTSKGGISTVNRQLAKLLSLSGAKVLCTVLSASEEDASDARNDGVELIFPMTLKSDKRHPNPDWLTFDHKARYPHLPSDITHIIGHASITSSAARNIKEQRYPAAKLILFNHVIPEDTEHYKNEIRELGIGEKIDAIRTDMEHADVVFSVGPYLHDYYRNQIRGTKPHHEFLPKPSDTFSQMDLTYVETETKVVLSIGRVKGAERLKGYDLAAKAMSMVISRFPKARWRVRGVSAEDFVRSKEIILANKAEFHFTPLKYGKQPELGRDMKEAHVVLMPSRAEPFGLVGLEAIAAGVPLVVSEKSGLAWFFKTQDPEFDRSIVKLTGNDEDDARLLAERIEEILRDGRREFNAARGLKQKLLSSKYWEDSHRKFLEECSIQ